MALDRWEISAFRPRILSTRMRPSPAAVHRSQCFALERMPSARPLQLVLFKLQASRLLLHRPRRLDPSRQLSARRRGGGGGGCRDGPDSAHGFVRASGSWAGVPVFAERLCAGAGASTAAPAPAAAAVAAPARTVSEDQRAAPLAGPALPSWPGSVFGMATPRRGAFGWTHTLPEQALGGPAAPARAGTELVSCRSVCLARSLARSLRVARPMLACIFGLRCPRHFEMRHFETFRDISRQRHS